CTTSACAYSRPSVMAAMRSAICARSRSRRRMTRMAGCTSTSWPCPAQTIAGRWQAGCASDEVKRLRCHHPPQHVVLLHEMMPQRARDVHHDQDRREIGQHLMGALDQVASAAFQGD